MSEAERRGSRMGSELLGPLLSRRDMLVGAATAVLTGGCRRQPDDVLRLGFMTNLTHAPAIAGVASGRLERALGLHIEATSFRAGPRVVEALVGGAIDVGVSGPAPVVYTHARHGAGTLRVAAGVSSGGASFVVGRASGIRGPDDLAHKTLATPQIGTTQDIALRKYLRAHGYVPAERGGDVTVHALDTSTILTEIHRGALDGAWLPEPWATRVVREVWRRSLSGRAGSLAGSGVSDRNRRGPRRPCAGPRPETRKADRRLRC